MIMKKEELLKIIDENLYQTPEILKHLANRMSEYQNQCEKINDILLRNALGSACQILAMKRRPSDKDMKDYCILIKKAQFPNGLESCHHQGEINFYNRFLKESNI
jgi:hypothetical protein